jgi:endonuclease/exonuclease/phosphatase family metal-dependent hydrolase
MLPPLIAIVASLMVQHGSAMDLKIAAFNIENFGRSENLWVDPANKNLNVNAVSQNAKNFATLMQDFDIIFIQEIKGERNLEVINELRDILNWMPMQTQQPHPVYELVWPNCVFDATGNHEVYVYYINTNKIPSGRWEHALYPSPGRLGDSCRRPPDGPPRSILFARPPYALCLKNRDGNCALFLLGLHAKPLGKCTKPYRPGRCTTREELDNLDWAYAYFSKIFRTRDAVLLGDFNADGKFLTYAQLRYLDLSRRESVDPEGPGWVHFDGAQHTNVNEGHPAMYDR